MSSGHSVHTQTFKLSVEKRQTDELDTPSM